MSRLPPIVNVNRPMMPPRPTAAIVPLHGGVIPLEYRCTCVNGMGKSQAFDDAGQAVTCSVCNGRGLVLAPQGQALLDFLTRYLNVPRQEFKPADK